MKRRRATSTRRARALRASRRAVRRRRLTRLAGRLRSRQSVTRRVVIAVALLVVVLIPLPVLASDAPPRPPGCAGDCRPLRVSAQAWAVPLSGTWSAGTGPGTTGDGGTTPAIGQAYVAAGGGGAVVGTGLTVTGYTLSKGKQLWQTSLEAPFGSMIASVRAWPGVVTAGLLAPDGRSRTEVVLNATTGAQLRSYPAAVFGGAVLASASTTVVVGNGRVTSYDNATGRVRWRHTAGGQSWQADGDKLYIAQSAGGYLGSSAVTALRVIHLTTGSERVLDSPLGRPFSGSLALAMNGVVLFAASNGVTAYSGSTGGTLWTAPGAAPEGTDPAAGLVYLTSPDGALTGVNPVTGRAHVSAPAAATSAGAGMYEVRGGIAFGLTSGPNGSAWGYDLAKGTVAWNSPALPWPHFFSDLSGLGGSAASSGDVVVITACSHLAASATCTDPELVALTV